MRTVVPTLAITILLASCSASPSYTTQECRKLVNAVESQDSNAISNVLMEMSDPGTDQNPHAVEPEIFADVLLVGQAKPRADFSIAMDVLVGDCRSKLGDARTSTSPQSISSKQASPDRSDLARTIKSELERIIDARHIPLVVTQAEFQEGRGDSQMGLPSGVWWVVQFDDPMKTGARTDSSFRQLIFITPWRLTATR